MNDLPDQDDEPGFGFAPSARDALTRAAEAEKPYRVLARKYRPSTFADLIGQEPMVRTLANAFETGRVHQAYILTGVRGVGKTTTARILARAFNYEAPGVDRPTIHMPTLGAHCQAIIDSRHVDVIEMDAASHTGIDDIREIIDNARYRPVMARTKVYIVDEVHMLSKAAFNGLLKTLEEPPEHVKFLFATTEIDKVPITVRSRCQRFDLRRIEADALAAHLSAICAKESVEIEPEALGLIARAAEGSARDALSLLDQAIAHAGAGSAGAAGRIESETVRRMLGLADRGRVIDLFEALMRGDIASALALLKEQYDLGADPAQALADLGAFVHFVTRVKLTPEAARDPAATPEEARRAQDFAARLSIRVLTRAWQMLLKGLQETKEAPRPLAAADMTLVRIAYAADLPSLDDALKLLDERGGGRGAPSRGAPPAGDSAPRGGIEAPRHTPSALLATDAPPAPRVAPRAAATHAAPVAQRPQPSAAAPPRRVALARFEDVVALAEANRDIQLKIALERDVRLVAFEQGRIDFALAPGGAPNLHQTLARRLQEWTGERWMAAISQKEGRPTLAEAREAERDRTLGEGAADPVVQRILDAFPGAKLTAIRKTEDEIAPALNPDAPQPRGDEDVSYLDEVVTEDDL